MEKKEKLVNIGKGIMWMRKAKGMTALDLAKKAGMHEVEIARIEEGNVKCLLSEIEQIASALDVPVVVFIYGACSDEERAKLSGTVQQALSHELLGALKL